MMPEYSNASISDWEVIADPHPYLHHLRASDPVHWDPKWNGWLVTRRDDLIKVMEDPFLEVYPNPAIDRITISYFLEGQETKGLRIVSIDGRVVRQIPLQDTANSIEVDIQSLVPGMYILSATSGKQYSKFVKH